MDVALRRSLLRTALNELEAGQGRVAEGLCRELLRQDDGDTEALLLLGLARSGARRIKSNPSSIMQTEQKLFLSLTRRELTPYSIKPFAGDDLRTLV